MQTTRVAGAAAATVTSTVVIACCNYHYHYLYKSQAAGRCSSGRGAEIFSSKS